MLSFHAIVLPSDVNRVYDLGANAYLVKPLDFDDLVVTVNTLNIHWLVLNEKPQISDV
jgi:DNA-binding NarL/FixJ family response regulator